MRSEKIVTISLLDKTKNLLVTTQQNVQRPFQLKPLNSNSEEMIYYWDTEGYVNFTKVIFRSINRKLVSGEVGKLSLSLVRIEQ